MKNKISLLRKSIYRALILIFLTSYSSTTYGMLKEDDYGNTSGKGTSRLLKEEYYEEGKDIGDLTSEMVRLRCTNFLGKFTLLWQIPGIDNFSDWKRLIVFWLVKIMKREADIDIALYQKGENYRLERAEETKDIITTAAQCYKDCWSSMCKRYPSEFLKEIRLEDFKKIYGFDIWSYDALHALYLWNKQHESFPKEISDIILESTKKHLKSLKILTACANEFTNKNIFFIIGLEKQQSFFIEFLEENFVTVQHSSYNFVQSFLGPCFWKDEKMDMCFFNCRNYEETINGLSSLVAFNHAFSCLNQAFLIQKLINKKNVNIILLKDQCNVQEYLSIEPMPEGISSLIITSSSAIENKHVYLKNIKEKLKNIPYKNNLNINFVCKEDDDSKKGENYNNFIECIHGNTASNKPIFCWSPTVKAEADILIEQIYSKIIPDIFEKTLHFQINAFTAKQLFNPKEINLASFSFNIIADIVKFEESKFDTDSKNRCLKKLRDILGILDILHFLGEGGGSGR